MDDRRHLLQRRTAFEIFHNVLNDPAELVTWKCTVRRHQLPARTRDMTDQVPTLSSASTDNIAERSSGTFKP